MQTLCWSCSLLQQRVHKRNVPGWRLNKLCMNLYINAWTFHPIYQEITLICQQSDLWSAVSLCFSSPIDFTGGILFIVQSVYLWYSCVHSQRDHNECNWCLDVVGCLCGKTFHSCSVRGQTLMEICHMQKEQGQYDLMIWNTLYC